jgi:hypothetical protein
MKKVRKIMVLEQIAEHFAMTPHQVQQESLRLYLERKLRLVESELFTLTQHYGVQTVAALDEAVQLGQFHEAETFDDYFRLDYLETERDTLQALLEQL